MSIEPSNPILNIGDLAKPAVVFVEKVSDAVGGLPRTLANQASSRIES